MCNIIVGIKEFDNIAVPIIIRDNKVVLPPPTNEYYELSNRQKIHKRYDIECPEGNVFIPVTFTYSAKWITGLPLEKYLENFIQYKDGYKLLLVVQVEIRINNLVVYSNENLANSDSLYIAGGYKRSNRYEIYITLDVKKTLV